MFKKIKKIWKSKNDLTSPLRALAKELWEIQVFFTNLKFDDFQKHERKPTKMWTSWKNEFQPRKDPKNVTSKNELQTRLEALIHSFERFKYVFQCE